MDVILLHVAALLIVALIFTVVERYWPAAAAERWWRRPLGIDLTYWFVGPLLNQIALLVALLAIGLGLLGVLGERLDRTFVEQLQHGRGIIRTWPVWVQGLTAFVLADFTLYWIHRAFHRIPFLWHLHAIHHSPTRIDWLAAVRNHPLNTLISTVILGAVLVGAGFPPTVLAGVLPVIGLFALLGHANVRWDFGPCRQMIASPTFHRWHHTTTDEGGDRNFSSFLPVWDRLFGTWYLPDDGLPQRFGIIGDPVPHRFVAQLWYPLRMWGQGLGHVAASRTRRILVALALCGMLLIALGALLAPLSTLLMQIALPRTIDQLHVLGYRRGGPPPDFTTGEHLHVTIPPAEAHHWFMAAAGTGLPPQVADHGTHLWGELRSADLGAPLPVLVTSGAATQPPRAHTVLDTTRVNALLNRGAVRDDSPWVLKLDAGCSLTDAAGPAPAGWDRTLVLRGQGIAARRDGQPGLVRIEHLLASFDLRLTTSGKNTRIAVQLRLDELALRDLRRDEPIVLPRLVWNLITTHINRSLAHQPAELPFVVDPATRWGLLLR